MHFLLCELGAFAAWFVYGSFFEWAFHKYLFHSPKIIRATFEAHDQTHHRLYGGDETYDLPSPEDPGGRHIMMDWFALPLFVGFHLPLFFLVQWLTGIPSVWGGAAAVTVYYLGYESLHFVMHVPRDRWIERTRAFKFLNNHHRLHHRDDATNLNVLVPLADVVLRTLRTRPARSIRASVPRTQRVQG